MSGFWPSPGRLEGLQDCKGPISPQEQVINRHLPDACNRHERRAICP